MAAAMRAGHRPPDAHGLQELAVPPLRAKKRHEGEAGDGGGKCEGQVHERVEHAFAGNS